MSAVAFVLYLLGWSAAFAIAEMIPPRTASWVNALAAAAWPAFAVLFVAMWAAGRGPKEES